MLNSHQLDVSILKQQVLNLFNMSMLFPWCSMGSRLQELLPPTAFSLRHHCLWAIFWPAGCMACIPEVQDNWFQMIWIKQDCKITSGGAFANIKQWTLWPPTSRWTILFSSKSLRFFFGCPAESSKRLSPLLACKDGGPCKKVWFLASKRDFKALEEEKLAFLPIAPPWMSWTMG